MYDLLVSYRQMEYVIGTWELVGLVVMPFLFGLLYGLHIAHKRFIVKMVKTLPDRDLGKLLDEDGDENTGLVTTGSGRGNTIPGHQTSGD